MDSGAHIRTDLLPVASEGAPGVLPVPVIRPSSRTIFDDDDISGWTEVYEVQPGFSLVAGRSHYRAARRDVLSGGQDFKLHFKLEGSSKVGDERGHEAITSAGSMAYLVQPQGSLKFEEHLSEVRESAVTFICSRGFLAELMNDAQVAVSGPIEDFIIGKDPDFHCGILPLPAPLCSLLGDILDPPYSGTFRTMAVHAKAMEVLCAALSRIAEHDERGAMIRPRDLAKVREVCEILQADPFSNTSISRLSRMVAWNESQMTEHFRQIMGTTVFGYRQKLRMDHALVLLRSSDQSITQIAFDAGYEHASNFATAFKRTFGFSPREARLNGHVHSTNLAGSGKS